MKSTVASLATAAALLIGLASASPTASPSNTTVLNTLEKRTPGGVFICTDINWGGTCGYAVQPLNTCIFLGDDWKNKISSFGPDPCTICFAYDSVSGDCNEAEWEFTYPGDDTGGLGTSNPWNDRIGAFMCEQTSC